MHGMAIGHCMYSSYFAHAQTVTDVESGGSSPPAGGAVATTSNTNRLRLFITPLTVVALQISQSRYT